jgi:selenocysteine-specific elongation factor
VKSIIVGTAGHIDHGKTALVKALTGIDADRLEEEKRRGITIDLGFAHLELSGPGGEPLRFGFVDVPGHERFVRNMLAGVGGIDLVLLVIAADEGIKPQTREHFDICRLLSIQRGITVLTKSDLVDSDTLDVVRLEIGDFLRGSFLENSPIIPVSSLTGTGLEELKHELVLMADTTPSRNSAAITRLPIDRVFTMKGFGTVVTGTLIAGSIRKEDELELFPSHKRARVRGVQVHGTTADRASAGERTALNLAGVEKSELERGMVLASAGLLQTSPRIDVRLSLLPSAKPLKQGTRVHLHALTSEVIATIKLHDAKQLQPGTDAFAELNLSEALPLFPGDRFIIRQFSPVITIGGGVVLDAFPLKKVTKAARSEYLQDLASADPVKVLKARVARRGERGLSFQHAIAETGWREGIITSRLGSMKQEIVRAGDVLLTTAALKSLSSRITSAVRDFQKRNPLVHGIAPETLRESTDVDPRLFEFVVASLVGDKQLEMSNGHLHLPGRRVVMEDDEAESRSTIEQTFASAGLKVPALKDVVVGLKIDKARAQKIVTLLLRDKTLIKVSDDLVFHHSALASLRRQLQIQKAKSPKLDVASFKDLAGVSRKYAIPLLEYLDRERVTRRMGDERVIL